MGDTSLWLMGVYFLLYVHMTIKAYTRLAYSPQQKLGDSGVSRTLPIERLILEGSFPNGQCPAHTCYVDIIE